jgi:hypothetical protein
VSKEEGYKRCAICDYCELSSEGPKRGFTHDYREDRDMCEDCAESIGGALSEFGFDEHTTEIASGNGWKDKKRRYTITKGVVRNRVGRPRKAENFPGYHPGQDPQEPAVRRPTASEQAYWDAILEAIDEVGE